MKAHVQTMCAGRTQTPFTSTLQFVVSEVALLSLLQVLLFKEI